MYKPFSLLLAGIILAFSSCHNETNSSGEDADSIMNLGDGKSADSTKKVVSAKNSTDTVLYGIDISRYQGNLVTDITTSDGLHFAICKATQGVTYVDPDFRLNWNTITEKGLIRGAYHFYICSDDPVQQAQHFSNTINDIQKDDIAPVLDIEQGSMSSTTNVTQMQKDILTFLQNVEKQTGRKPILYTDYAFAQQYLMSPAFAVYDLWLAEYSGAPEPKVPEAWKAKGFKIWQKSDSYDVNSQQIDYDVHFGTVAELTK